MKDMSWPRSIKGKNNNDLQYSISAKDGLAGNNDEEKLNQGLLL